MLCPQCHYRNARKPDVYLLFLLSSVAAVFLVLYCFEQMRPRGSSASYSTLLTTQGPGKLTSARSVNVSGRVSLLTPLENGSFKFLFTIFTQQPFFYDTELRMVSTNSMWPYLMSNCKVICNCWTTANVSIHYFLA